MTVNESKSLKKGTRVYWRGDAADSGIVTETSWDAVSIAWNNGQVARVHHGDMREFSKRRLRRTWRNGSRTKPMCPTPSRLVHLRIAEVN
jgi:hypothetical protein